MKQLGILAVTVVLFGAIVAWTFHVWDDCLEENSVFTCMRMLNK